MNASHRTSMSGACPYSPRADVGQCRYIPEIQMTAHYVNLRRFSRRIKISPQTATRQFELQRTADLDIIEDSQHYERFQRDISSSRDRDSYRLPKNHPATMVPEMKALVVRRQIRPTRSLFYLVAREQGFPHMHPLSFRERKPTR